MIRTIFISIFLLLAKGICFSQQSQLFIIEIKGIALDFRSGKPLRLKKVKLYDKPKKHKCFDNNEVRARKVITTDLLGRFRFVMYSFNPPVYQWISMEESAPVRVKIPAPLEQKETLDLDSFYFVWYDFEFTEKCYGDSTFTRENCIKYPRSVKPQKVSDIARKLRKERSKYKLRILEIDSGFRTTRFTPINNPKLRVHCEFYHKTMSLSRIN